MGNEDDLPGVTDWEQIKRCRGDRTVHCIVSERYLRFGVAHHSAFEDGHPLTVDVMLDRHYNAIRPHSALRWTPRAPEVRLPTPQVWPAMTLAHHAPTNYH